MNTGISRSTSVFLMLGAAIGTAAYVHGAVNDHGVPAQGSRMPMRTTALNPGGRRLARIVAEAAANSAAQSAHGMMLPVAGIRDLQHSENTVANAR